MALKKNDRIEVTQGGVVKHGFVLKAGAKITMVLDDGKSSLAGGPQHFRPSNAPVPPDSPFAKVFTEKGTRVQFEHQGKTVKGIVVSGSVFDAKVRTDGADWTVSQTILAVDPTPVPQDQPTAMDRWSLRRYQPVARLSEETLAFTAEILLDGKKVLDARNDGHGGCNYYYGDRQAQDQFYADAKAWATTHGDEKAFEPDGAWVSWVTEEKPLGITATEHFAAYKARWDALVAEHGEPGAHRM